MEITIREIEEAAAAKRRRFCWLIALWMGGLILLILSAFVNWGLLLAAALVSVIALVARKAPILIGLDDDRLMIRQGNANLWGAAREGMEAVELAEESKRFGITFAVKLPDLPQT